MGGLRRPPGPCRTAFPLLTGAINSPSSFPRPKVVAGDFSALDNGWSTFINPNCSLTSVANIQQERGIEHLLDPKADRNILDLIFTVGLKHFCTSIKSSFPWSDHLPVSCTFIPFRCSFPLPASSPYLRAQRDHLLTLLRSSNWFCFLASRVQMEANGLCSLLHECLCSVTPAQTH